MHSELPHRQCVYVRDKSIALDKSYALVIPQDANIRDRKSLASRKNGANADYNASWCIDKLYKFFNLTHAELLW